MSHCATSNLIAVFSMPGLEEIAAPLFPYATSRTDAVALVGYLAGRSAVGSAAMLDAELKNPRLWDEICAAAESHGRVLPLKPPTFNKLRHLRKDLGADEAAVLIRVQNQFIVESLKIARLVGLARPSSTHDLLRPVQENTLYADGTWWKPLSNVKVDKVTGEVRGSRSKGVQGPRVAEVRTTTKHGEQLIGIPIVLAGVRGAGPLQRVVLGYRRFVAPGLDGDGAETPAAMELLTRIIERAEGGLPWCIYDMAFVGQHLEELARLGVVGVAAMASAPEDVPHLPLAADADGPKRYNNDGRKTRMYTGSVAIHRHHVGGRWCEHALSGVDGSLRCHPIDRPVRANDPLCPVSNVAFEGPPGKQRLLATFEIPCPHGPLYRRFDLTGKVPGSEVRLLNRLRPINEYDPQFEELKGWRQDVESLNSTMKRAAPLEGRATSLSTAAFELDVMGSALRINAQAWDAYAGHVSHCAREGERRRRNRALRRPALVG